MNEPIKKPPVDELFARKLADLSLPPDKQSFVRLQARMSQRVQPVKPVFWHTSTFQRSLGAAACLLLVTSFGWYFWNGKSADLPGRQTAIADETGPAHSTRAPKLDGSIIVAQTDVSRMHTGKGGSRNTRVEPAQRKKKITREDVILAKTLGFGKSQARTERIAKAEESGNKKSAAESNEGHTALMAAPVSKSTTTMQPEATPRTLVVTIAEPDVLIAARQTAQEAETKVVSVKSADAAGPGKLWRKIQRIRTGESMVAETAAEDDDRGLIDRAYGQLKHSFQKNKSAKQ